MGAKAQSPTPTNTVPPSQTHMGSEDLISPSFCFSCDDFDLCTLFSWSNLTSSTGSSSISSQEEDILITSTTSNPHHKERRHNNNRALQSRPLISSSTHHHHYKIKSQKPQLNKRRGWTTKSNNDHPPPVIALSRSSFSNGSASSADSALETTEVDRLRDNYDLKKKKKNRFFRSTARSAFALAPIPGYRNKNVKGVDARCGGDSMDIGGRERSSSLSSNEENDGNDNAHNAVDFAVRHELLLNALFEDAKHRREQKAAANTSTNVSITPSSASTPLTPPRSQSRETQVQSQSAMSVVSKSSRHSRRSTGSAGSDLLNPSAHQYKKSLKSKRKCKHRALAVLKSKKRRERERRLCQECSSACMSSSQVQSQSHSFHGPVHHLSHSNRILHSLGYALMSSSYGSGTASTSHDPPVPSPCRTNEDSSCTSLTTSTHPNDVAHSFLHAKCQLQKDSGKGVHPGSGVTATGRDSAMAKLVEKMDLLGKIEQEGSFTNAVLTRVPAKDMTLARREAGVSIGHANLNSSSHANANSLPQNTSYDSLNDRGLIETRSMLAIKMGFASMRYGVIVHWNVNSGLAELIVLRKMCLESFMKVKSKSKAKVKVKAQKSWRKRIRRMSSSANTNPNVMNIVASPTMMSLDEGVGVAAAAAAESNDSSYGSLGLEPVESAPY